MREVVLDTETTGMEDGDRVIEIGCVELVDRKVTGREFHRYLSPGRVRVNPGAFRVHGLSDAFLANKPAFEDIVEDLLEFLRGSTLVIHNARFDVGMINREFGRLYTPPPLIVLDSVIDTLAIARKKRGRAGNKLDDLAKHFKVNRPRSKHGALLDAQILAEVYLHLIGKDQIGLALEAEAPPEDEADDAPRGSARVFRSRITADEQEAHTAFRATLGSAPIWGDYIGEDKP